MEGGLVGPEKLGKCVKVSDFQRFLFQKVVECHGEKRRGGQVLLDRFRLLGSQDSPGVLKIFIYQ